MPEPDHHQPAPTATRSCFSAPHHNLVSQKELGMDINLAEVTLLICPVCGQYWLRYF